MTFGIATAAKIPMIAITISSSINVKPRWTRARGPDSLFDSRVLSLMGINPCTASFHVGDPLATARGTDNGYQFLVLRLSTWEVRRLPLAVLIKATNPC